jgi:hypothetical protein
VSLRKKLAAVLAATLMLALSSGPAAFAANPPGTGQPDQECGEEGAELAPPGFGTGGFANAEVVYAGSEGTASLNANSSHAVSQYDVACYQVTTNSGV